MSNYILGGANVARAKPDVGSHWPYGPLGLTLGKVFRPPHKRIDMTLGLRLTTGQLGAVETIYASLERAPKDHGGRHDY